jgi:ADP-L-glycero-D-manno-heptose 6-epimerase
MKIILTGSKGFIGGALLKALNKQDNTYVDVLDQNKDQWENEQAIEQTVSHCDVIFHVGAISDTTLQDCNEMLYWNYTLSKKLFDLARKYDKKVVYSSSAATYGLGDGLPTNIYGWSKLITENYGIKVCDDFVSLRYFNVYGPGEDHKGKMASVAYQAYKSQDLFKLFPKTSKRDFVYIEDVINANIHAINSPKGIYEVGTGEARTFEDVLDNMHIEYSYHSEDTIPNWYQFYTKSDKKNWLPDWKPMYNLEKGINEYKKYFHSI